MKHEFKQGDEIEYKKSQSEKWEKATYIGFHAGKHVIGFEYGRLDVLFEWEKAEIRPIKKRWRAEFGKPYFCVLSGGDHIDSVEHNDGTDDERYSIGNYFRTAKQAEQAAELIKQTFKKFHDEIANTQ